jgi:hypothetical protein
VSGKDLVIRAANADGDGLHQEQTSRGRRLWAFLKTHGPGSSGLDSYRFHWWVNARRRAELPQRSKFALLLGNGVWKGTLAADSD